MVQEYIEELKNVLQNKYGDLNDSSGCSILVDGEYEWLSVNDIVNIIDKVFEAYDWED